MKTISALLIALSFLSSSCKPPPKYKPSSKVSSGGGSSGEGSSNPATRENDPDELGGSEVEVKDRYVGLQCNMENPTGFRAWRRLSNIELKNTIASVFRVKDVDVTSLPDDITRLGVYDTMMISVNFVDVQRYRATRLIIKAVVAKLNLAEIFPCIKEGASCVNKTLPTLGSLAYRRPLTPEETTSLSGLFTAMVPDVGNEGAARLLIEAIMLSQPFLYRSELGVKTEGTVYTLTDWELASAISYSILRAPPDDELRKAAESKSLGKEDEIKKQIKRLLADAKSKESLKDFANMWLDSRAILKADRPAIKEFSAEVKQKSMLEVGNLFSAVLSRPSGATLESLMVADKIPSTSGFIYDAMVADGQVQFKEAERRGIFGQASFLASTSAVDYTNPVKRGAFVIERMLCTGFEKAPVIVLPEKKEGESNLARFRSLSGAGGCAKCHLPMNSFGFVFENFDPIGKYRTMADNEKIEINSEVTIDDKAIVVTSPAELSAAIAKSEQGKECYSRHLLRYSFGRQEYTPLPIIGAKKGSMVTITEQGKADACHIKSMTDAMTEADGDLMAPLAKLLSSEGFRKRIDRTAEKVAEH